MTKDLMVLVADMQQESTVKTLLVERQQALAIRPIVFDITRHPRKDSGDFHEAHDFLAIFQPPQYNHAMVILDQEWDGTPGDATHLRDTVLQRLYSSGWHAGACEVIVCDPELEAWVWSGSKHVPEALRTTWDAIHTLAQERGYWAGGAPKPSRPKELLEAILRQQRRPRSSAIFQELARQVGLRRCQDPAFNRLRHALASWFAP
jgi:hypothetical protein